MLLTASGAGLVPNSGRGGDLQVPVPYKDHLRLLRGVTRASADLG